MTSDEGWQRLLSSVRVCWFGGIFNPPKSEPAPDSMLHRCPLCQGDVRRGWRTTHLMEVHKRSRDEAKALIRAYCK